jgi:hypothetical protein
LRAQPLFGQLGSVFLLEDAVSSADVQKMFELGSNMTPLVSSDTTETLTGQKDGSFVVDKKFLARVMFSYTAKVIFQYLNNYFRQ